MAFPAIPVVIILLGCGAYLKRDKTKGVMTEARTKVFHAALSGGIQDPANLDKLASTFAGQGLPEQAALLRQRAALKRLPNEVKLVRREIWRKAIASKNKPVMAKIAAAYEREGCTSAAMRLREIISGLPDNLPPPQSSVAGESSEETTEDSSEQTEAQPEEREAAE